MSYESFKYLRTMSWIIVNIFILFMFWNIYQTVQYDMKYGHCECIENSLVPHYKRMVWGASTASLVGRNFLTDEVYIEYGYFCLEQSK